MNAYQMFCNRYLLEPPEKALKDLKQYWPDEVSKKQLERAELLQLEAVGNSEVHTGNISDATGKAGEKRAELQEEIDAMMQIYNALTIAYYSLPEVQREVLDIFYFKTGVVGSNIEKFGKEHGYSIRAVYREKIAALDRFKYNVKEHINAL